MQSTKPFTLNISRYKEVPETKKTVVYYDIEVHKTDGDSWNVEKRFKEFDQLNSVLKKVYPNLPAFPSKSLFSLKGGEDVEKRRSDLEQYMQGLIARSDIINSEVVKRFLEFDSASSDPSLSPPKLVGEIPGLIMGVRDFYFQIDEGLFFVGLSDMSVTSRVDSYITNIKIPWGKEGHKEGAAVGSVECYKQIGSQSEFKFEKLWFKMFTTQVINIYWDQASCLFLVGKDDGTVTVLKVSSELNYTKYDEVVTNKLHQKRVMGVYIDSISEFVYSVGEDKKFKVYDLRKNDLVADITCGNDLLTALVPDKENKRAFISNRNGQVFIYDIGSTIPKYIHVIQAHPKGSIRGIYFDSYKNYLLTANYDDGYISMTDVQKPDRVKYSQVTTHLKGKKKVRCLVWCTSKAEVYAGGEDGALSFWDVKRNFPVYILKAHAHGVTKLQHLSTSNVLISGGKDGKIKFYKLPEEWSDKILENVDLKEGEYASPNGVTKITASILESNKQAKRALDDSDEEGEGWAQEF